METLPRLRSLAKRTTAPLPEGTLAVGAGLVVAGLTAYGFLVLSARALGPERYASLSALWALVFLLGPGLFLPVEQEVSRAISSRRVRGLGGGPVVKRAAVAGVGLALVLVIVTSILSDAILSQLFDGQVLLLIGLCLGFVFYSLQHLARGTLSGNGRFTPYGLLVGSEGVIRLVGCIALAALGISQAGPYGLVVGLAPLVALGVALRRQRGLIEPGPEAPWTELSGALGYLLAGSLFAQALMNAGPLAVKLIATAEEQAAAGRFLAGLVIARIPLFLFQAVQAALLPRLARLAASGRHEDFRTGLRRLLVAVAIIGSTATIGAFAIGPWVVELLFGPRFVLGRSDLTYLAAASAIYMLALALAQALIALKGHARAALGWLGGVVAFVVVVIIESGLLLRVERGFLAGSIAALTSMAFLLIPRLPGAGVSGESLVEASHEIPIEP